jgi:putative membrane protein
MPNTDELQAIAPVDPRVYFAAERTLLAWIRTGLAMMGFGFVVARFGLFLREMAVVRGVPPQQPVGASLVLGTSLVVLAIVVHVLAVVRHWRTVRRLEANLPMKMHPLSLVSLVSLALAIIGMIVVGYLLFGVATTE